MTEQNTGPVQVACLGFVFDPMAQAVLREIVPPGLELSFAQGQHEITEAMLARSDVLLVVAPVTDAMMSQAPRLRLIQKWGSGYDKIDIEAAARRGITVAITAGANANTIAEHAISLMLTVMRRIVVADREVRRHRWDAGALRPHMHRLYGSTVGIIGFGNIGKAVARQLQGFDAEILYVRRSGPDPDAAALGAGFAALDDLLARSDIVTLHCPGGGANRHMIAKASFAKMKPGAVLINVARGDLVVERDLVEALEQGTLSGAGLDVFAEEPLPVESSLRRMDNVVLTPHAAGGVVEDLAPMGAHAFRNILRFLQGEPLPAADLIVAPSGACR